MFEHCTRNCVFRLSKTRISASGRMPKRTLASTLSSMSSTPNNNGTRNNHIIANTHTTQHAHSQLTTNTTHIIMTTLAATPPHTTTTSSARIQHTHPSIQDKAVRQARVHYDLTAWGHYDKACNTTPSNGYFSLILSILIPKVCMCNL